MLIIFLLLLIIAGSILISRYANQPKVEALDQDLILPKPEKKAIINYDKLFESGLSKREYEVLLLLAKKFSNKQIAEALDISEHTAKGHVSAVLQKLGVTKRSEVPEKAKTLGLI